MRFFWNFCVCLLLLLSVFDVIAARGYTPLEIKFASGTKDEAAISAFFKHLDGQIFSLLGGSDFKCVINIELKGGPAGLKMEQSGVTAVLTLSGEPGLYSAYSETMLKVIGVLAHAKLGRWIEPDSARVPDWVGAAILDKLDDNLTFLTGSPDGTVVVFKVFRPRRDMSGMRLLMTFGDLPDFRDFLLLKVDKMPPITREVFAHYSRFVLDEISTGNRQKRVLGEYLSALADGMSSSAAGEMILGRSIDEKTERYLTSAGQNAVDLSASERRGRYLTMRASRMAFNANYPYNPIAAKRRLGALRKVWFRELDEAKVPTGKLLSCDLSELPEVLKNHPDGQRIWSFKVAEFATFRQRLSFAANDEAQKLEKILMEFPNYWFSSGKSEIKDALVDLERAFDKQQKWFDYVVKTEERLLPVQLVYTRELDVERFYADSDMTPPMKAFLDSMASKFSGD